MQSSKLYIYGLGGKFIPQAIYILTNLVLARLLSPSDRKSNQQESNYENRLLYCICI